MWSVTCTAGYRRHFGLSEKHLHLLMGTLFLFISPFFQRTHVLLSYINHGINIVKLEKVVRLDWKTLILRCQGLVSLLMV